MTRRTWRLEEEKFRTYWHGIEDALNKGKVTLQEMKQVTGRIVYVSPMMPEGRFWLSEILVLANIDKDLRVVVNIDQETKVQLRWWQVGSFYSIVPVHYIEDLIYLPTYLGSDESDEGWEEDSQEPRAEGGRRPGAGL